MKRIYSVLVENRSGVLCKVAGLFSEDVLILTALPWERPMTMQFPV